MIEDIITFIAGLPDWVEAATALVTGATALTLLTPTQADNKIINLLLKALNILAGNILENKNADDV